MNKIKTVWLAFGATLILSGCATSFGHFPDSSQNKGKQVSSSLNQFNIFWLTPADHLDQLVHDLSEQCNNGKVEGITVTQTDRYMLIGQMETYDVVGHCAE